MFSLWLIPASCPNLVKILLMEKKLGIALGVCCVGVATTQLLYNDTEHLRELVLGRLQKLEIQIGDHCRSVGSEEGCRDELLSSERWPRVLHEPSVQLSSLADLIRCDFLSCGSGTVSQAECQ
jgi:hypothetical protein